MVNSALQTYKFVVISKPNLWPYSGEVPYAAWPEKTLIYDSWGNDPAWPEGREWSYLSLMNVANRETIIAVDTGMIYPPKDYNLKLVNGIFASQGELVIWTQLGSLPISTLKIVPEYRSMGNVCIASFGCSNIEPAALVTRLFMKHLKSELVWDGQANVLRNRQDLEVNYLDGYHLEMVDNITDEIRLLCATGHGRRWYMQATKEKYHNNTKE